MYLLVLDYLRNLGKERVSKRFVRDLIYRVGKDYKVKLKSKDVSAIISKLKEERVIIPVDCYYLINTKTLYIS